MHRFLFVVFSILLLGFPCHGKPRLALVPLMYDFQYSDGALSKAAGGFDARLQAELLADWDVELVSRSHLSKVVFEQKLKAATDAAATPVGEVLPADIIVAPILDFAEKKLRFYVVPVKKGMKVPNPKLIAFKDVKEFDEKIIPESTKLIAREARLSARDAAAETTGAKPSVPEQGGKLTDLQPLTCALLTAVCTDDLRRAADSQAPLIQAVLEQSLSTMEAGRIRLIERNQLTKLIDEKVRNSLSSEWDPNAVSSIGRLAKAELLLIPYVHAIAGNKVRTVLFAVNTNGGLVTACASWEGASEAPPPASKISSVLRDGITNRGATKNPPANLQREQRHAEAGFLAEISRGGARSSPVADYYKSLRLADAIIGLTADDKTLMSSLLDRFWPHIIPKYGFNLQAKYRPRSRIAYDENFVKKSGLLPKFQEEGREVLQMPFQEFAKSGSEADLTRLAHLYIQLDEPAKALDVLMSGGSSLKELANNRRLMGVFATALLDLKRYKECKELVLLNGLAKDWLSLEAWECCIAVCRELGDKETEFYTLCRWMRYLADDQDFLVHRLELGMELGKAREIVTYVTNYWHYGTLNNRDVRIAMIKARLAAGQKELAVSDMQGALICDRIDNKKQSVAEFEAMLAREGAKPLEKFPPARDFLKVPESWCIHLIHDQSITPDYAKTVADQLADIWGCRVKIWSLKLDVEKLSFHNRLRKDTSVDGILNLVTRAEKLPDPYLGFVYLTHLKGYYYKDGNRLVNAASYWSRYITFVSDAYTQLYNPKPVHFPATVSLCASFAPVSQYLNTRVPWEHGGQYYYQLTDPDMFASLQTFEFSHRGTGVSPTTGKQLAKIDLDELRAFLDEQREDSRQTAMKANNDPEAVEDISRQFATQQPVIVEYPPLPADTDTQKPNDQNPSNPPTPKP